MKQRLTDQLETMFEAESTLEATIRWDGTASEVGIALGYKGCYKQEEYVEAANEWCAGHFGQRPATAVIEYLCDEAGDGYYWEEVDREQPLSPFSDN